MQKNKWLILAGSIIVILLLAVGIWAYQNKSGNDKLVLQQDPGLTNNEKDFYTTRIAQLEQNFADKNLSKEDRFETYLSVGANYVLVGDYANARDAFAEASKLMPDNIVPLKELLILSGKMNDQKAAQKYYDKLVEIDPVNKELYTQMFSEIQGK
jgi:lipoprotein NlpI